MSTLTEMGVTHVLGAFAAGDEAAATDHAPEVTRALLDTVAVALGARGAEGDRVLRTWAAGESSTGPATVWTSGEAASPSVAALVNGTAGHLLDYDDVSPSMPLHPSTVLLPALVAVAEARGVGPGRFTAAYDVGAAAFRAVAEVLPQRVHYARGWHTTSTVGRLAAVAALVRLTGADESTARHALGLVASLAAGSRANFGSMTKPLHAGAAARDAVMALELAEAGFTANEAELDAPSGFLERYGASDLGPVGLAAETVDERLAYWLDAWPSDWGLKRYPSCYGTHRGIDATLALRDRAEGRVPRSIHATLHPRGTRPLRTSPPTTGTEAKFSLEYTLAVAWLRGAVTLQDFTDEALADPAVQTLMASVVVEESEVPPVGPEEYTSGYTVVEVVLDDGATETARVDVTHGQNADPLTDAELRAKLHDCAAAGGLTPAEADRVHDAVVAGPGPAFTSAIPRRTS